MELLISKKFKLPDIFFISNKNEISKLPLGVPFFYGDEPLKPFIIKLLEYEIIYKKALSTGLPFNFKLLLEEAGFELEEFSWQDTLYMNYVDEKILGGDFDIDNDEDNKHDSISNLNTSENFKNYIKDSTAYVDIDKIKSLNIFPSYFTDLEKAVNTNIHNYIIYNPHMYNKKLEGMYGDMDLLSPDKNLINMDWSSSIPKAIATFTATLAKWMAETFFCDLLITAHKTVFIPYEELHSFNIEDLYNKYNGGQECKEYRRIITSDIKHYKTCIIFGDNNSVCDSWDAKEISREKGKKLCKWTIDKLICFHTTSNNTIPGFADWFSPKEVEYISDWVKYLNNYDYTQRIN